MCIKYPSVSKILWETKTKREREKIEKFSNEHYKKFGIQKHKEIEENNSLIFNDSKINIVDRFGEPLYKEKFLKCHRHKYCGKIDYFSKDQNIIEWKFIQTDKYLSYKLKDYQLQLGAYYNLLNRFKKISAKLILFINLTGEIKEYNFSKKDLVFFKKEFIKKVHFYQCLINSKNEILSTKNYY